MTTYQMTSQPAPASRLVRTATGSLTHIAPAESEARRLTFCGRRVVAAVAGVRSDIAVAEQATCRRCRPTRPAGR